MVKRFLDCNFSDIANMSKKELLESIKLSEGRVIATEVIGSIQPILYDISNAELVSAFGTDIIILNMFDVFNPVFYGIGNVDKDRIIKEIKKLTGRPIAINLEPIDEENEEVTSLVTEGRRANVKAAKRALELGVDMIVITANPKTLVMNYKIAESIKMIKDELGDKIIIAAGKMHAAGSLDETGNNILTLNDIEQFINSGADIILLPAPGTVPGLTVEYIRMLIDYVHKRNILAMTTIGTSQEGADKETIRSIALMCKMAGADIHHIGDSGYPGVAIPENILAYSIAIRGKRHTYSRMARSINR